MEKIGFGEQSRRATTRNSNYFARFSTTPTNGGCDIVVEAVRGMTFEDGGTSVTLHLRKDHGPRVGERVMVGRTLVKVLDRRYDQSGNLMLLDEDTKAWHQWKGETDE